MIGTTPAAIIEMAKMRYTRIVAQLQGLSDEIVRDRDALQEKNKEFFELTRTAHELQEWLKTQPPSEGDVNNG